MEDPGVHQQEQQTDPEAHPETDPSGRPMNEQVSQGDLVKGLNFEDETPEETHVKYHPTPERPSGRLTP